jgi:hypothetical protein
LVLPIGNNIAGKAVEHNVQVVNLSLLEQNHCLARPNNENRNKQSRTASLETSFIMKVLHISKKF